MNTHIAIFASGSGTNAENIIQYFSKSKSIEVSLVVSNRSDAYVLERARLLKVPELIITKKEFSESEYYVLTKLRDFHGTTPCLLTQIIGLQSMITAP